MSRDFRWRRICVPRFRCPAGAARCSTVQHGAARCSTVQHSVPWIVWMCPPGSGGKVAFVEAHQIADARTRSISGLGFRQRRAASEVCRGSEIAVGQRRECFADGVPIATATTRRRQSQMPGSRSSPAAADGRQRKFEGPARRTANAALPPPTAHGPPSPEGRELTLTITGSSPCR